MRNYNVLWIDDEPDKQDAFFERAEMDGILLKNFTTSKAGMEELSDNLHFYDAVILDAKVYNESEDEVARLTGLQNSMLELRRLSVNRFIPYFIFSGQPDVIGSDQVIEMLGDHPIYQKSVDEDKLFRDIKKASDQQPETQIRHEYAKAFGVIEDFNPEASKSLMKILKAIKNGGNDFDDKEQFTQLRIILEMMFRKANEVGLLHDKCIPRGNVNLTDSSLFLAGENTKHSKVRSTKTHFPKIIANIVKNILFITGGASHTAEVDPNENINVQEYREMIKTPYLLFSLTFQLMDVLVWFDGYCKENPVYDENKKSWELIAEAIGPEESAAEELMPGKVINHHPQKGFAFFKPDAIGDNVFIPPDLVTANSLHDEMPVRVEVEEYTYNRTGEIKKRVKRIEKI